MTRMLREMLLKLPLPHSAQNFCRNILKMKWTQWLICTRLNDRFKNSLKIYWPKIVGKIDYLHISKIPDSMWSWNFYQWHLVDRWIWSLTSIFILVMSLKKFLVFMWENWSRYESSSIVKWHGWWSVCILHLHPTQVSCTSYTERQVAKAATSNCSRKIAFWCVFFPENLRCLDCTTSAEKNNRPIKSGGALAK